MMEPKLSVIVPIYNVEEYLPHCIESVLAQTFTDLELILIDDGSTDNCPQICDEYAGKDERIRVIHQSNQGVSMARNAAMKMARGLYIAFVDGDDFIFPDAYEPMVREMETHQLDILAGSCCRMIDGQIRYYDSFKRTFPNRVYPGTDFMYLCLKQGFMGTGCWLNMYDRKFLLDNRLFFQDVMHEDELWIPPVFFKAQRVKYMDSAFYIYLLRENSCTTAKDRTQNGIDLLKTCYELEKFYAQIGDKEKRKYFNDFLLQKFLFAVFMGKLYRPPYRHLLRRGFVLGKPLKIKNRIKAGVFCLSPWLYVKIAESIH